jgi:hypothetical protein
LLLFTAVAIAVLAVPASALAAQWLDGGKSFNGKRELKMTSGEVIEVGAAGKKT